MSNLVPLVKIKLDKVRHLRLDLNAMVAYEQASGESISTVGLNPSIEQIRCLLWACLLHEDKELTPEAVGAMVHAGNFVEIAETLTKTFEVVKPEGGPIS